MTFSEPFLLIEPKRAACYIANSTMPFSLSMAAREDALAALRAGFAH